MKIYDLYGSAVLTPDELREHLGAALGLVFDGREHRDRHGVYHRSGGRRGERFIVRANQSDTGGELVEPGYPGYPTLLEAHESPRADELLPILSSLSGLVFLRRDVVG